jgi:hypothetical protein
VASFNKARTSGDVLDKAILHAVATIARPKDGQRYKALGSVATSPEELQLRKSGDGCGRDDRPGSIPVFLPSNLPELGEEVTR